MRKLLLTVMCLVAMAAIDAQGGGDAGPRMTIETVKGTIEIQFFAADAPRTVEKIVAMAKKNFYRGQRIHRVERSLVQFGDPVSRDMSRQSWWGRAGSGDTVGVAEFSKRSHVRGTVSMAYGGSRPENADSQLFILKTAAPSYNGKYVIVGQVTSGMDVVDQLEVADVLRQVRITE